ncbi:uncharacterized protein PITG_04117 [Phytophthora infestans T30-4]|uniref:Uncharacterized protein n=1 Tax=Phytophthora infestans (strain T30-4) TaxID=403677 RepID=D0N0L3_PHYIT|nr:uncharacterized protein PITG_04117 [Phytophthora infestans T30-4]EEY67176.1 conserved hypothetical protein [Phytophthora infestans T30-4]|eukprot:XP_002905824.1 conserved hypothetical protein [Phytophthora infestans T30-4]
MSIPQPNFEVIKAPELTSWEHAALIEWHREWERYDNVAATVKGSVRRQTLNNLAKYVPKKPIASVTDADIMSVVEARCRTLKNEFVPDVSSLFRANLRMNMTIDDCDARIFRYYEYFYRDSDAGYKSRMKARCRLLVENLQPPVLKAQIGRLIDLERRDCKSDDVALFDLILEHVKIQQRFHPISQDYAGKQDSKTIKPEKKPRRGAPTKPTSAPSPAPTTTTTATGPCPTRSPPRDGCLGREEVSRG